MRADAVGRLLVWIFGLTWVLNLVLYWLGGLETPAAAVVLPVQMLIPGVTAAVLIRSYGGRLGDYGLRWGGLRYYGLAYLIVLGLVAAHGLVAWAPGWVEWLPMAEGLARLAPEAELPAAWLLFLGVFVGAPLVNIIFGLGEEFGWRGYLLDLLLPKGLFYAILISGVVWGLWHAPVILMGHNFPANPWWGVLLMTLACVPLGAIFTWLRLVSGSAVVAGFAHGAFNALVFFGGMVYPVEDLLFSNLLGLSGLPVLVAGAWALFRFFPPGRMRLIEPGRPPVV